MKDTPKAITEVLDRIRKLADGLARPVKLMEVCGTHTMSAFRSGLRSLLPENVVLLSGPGCPVCVTPNAYLDRAIAMSLMPEIDVFTFGDMIRVPGSRDSLERARARGGNVRVVYSPSDALEHAAANPNRRVVFLGVGFETTSPGIAWTIKQANIQRLENYMVYCGHKVIPPAMEALIASPGLNVDAFLCPGHVSVIIGSRAYEFACGEKGVPCVVAGFEPLDMALSIEMALRQIADNRSEVEIQYTRSVELNGNAQAQSLLAEVFESCDHEWRGLGTIPGSGYAMRETYASQDALAQVDVEVPEPQEIPGCQCGEILKGVKTPLQCPLFQKACTPETPRGACMVSSEGTCAAYYKYGGGSFYVGKAHGSARISEP